MSGDPAVPQADQVTVALDPAPTLAGYVGHRRRFAACVVDLDEASLATPSRCSLWSVADVLRHGADVDEWMHGIWSGNPPFRSFDPNVTPHEHVVAGRAMSDAAARDRFVESSGRMAADIEGSGPERWGLPSVSPIGIVPWWMSALHVFFDSWMHERDVFMPLGAEPVVEPDEIRPVLTYALALTGLFVDRPFDAVLEGVRLVAGKGKPSVEPVAPHETRTAAALADALSGRGPIEAAVPDLAPETIDAIGGLSRALTPA